jgi:hypothetical protein
VNGQAADSGSAPSETGLRLVGPEGAGLDFGTIVRAGRADRTFSIYNPQSVEVTVERIETSCDCFQLRLHANKIGPREAVEATATVSLVEEPDFAGDLSLTAEGFTSSGQRVFIVHARATVSHP